MTGNECPRWLHLSAYHDLNTDTYRVLQSQDIIALEIGRMPSSGAMNTVKITEILECHDGILAFVAQDPIGGHYVGSLIERTQGNDRYLVAGANSDCLNELRSGQIDLRALLLETPEGEWYITTPKGMMNDSLTLEPQQTPLAETDCRTA